MSIHELVTDLEGELQDVQKKATAQSTTFSLDPGNSHMNAFQLDEFVSLQQNAISGAEKGHSEILDDIQARIEDLQVREAAAGDAALQAQKQMQRETSELAKAQREVSSIEAEAKDLPATVTDLQNRLQQAQSQLRELESVFFSKQSKFEHDIEHLQATVHKYQQIGLEFRRLEGGKLQLVFTRVAEHDPSREFSFTIGVSSDDHYTLYDCTPRVSGTDELLNELNRSNNFSLFAQRMRKRFSQLV